MAVTVPDWADILLDLIGVAWPNVDEDAYREMADALREFVLDHLTADPAVSHAETSLIFEHVRGTPDAHHSPKSRTPAS